MSNEIPSKILISHSIADLEEMKAFALAKIASLVDKTNELKGPGTNETKDFIRFSLIKEEIFLEQIEITINYKNSI